MNFDMKRPCDNCPFRYDKHFPLTGERAEELAEGITSGDQAFSCHKTVDYSDDDDGADTKDTPHCAGAMIMLEHMEQPNQMMRIGERVGFYERTKLDMSAPVYDDADTWVDAMYHAERQEKK